MKPIVVLEPTRVANITTVTKTLEAAGYIVIVAPPEAVQVWWPPHSDGVTLVG